MNNSLLKQHPTTYASELDASQEAFCAHKGNAIRLLAPAGCGKTMSLLWRCVRLVEEGGDYPPRLLLLTFTRAARDELLGRIEEQSEFRNLRQSLRVTTLNSWGSRTLHRQKVNLRLKIEGQDRQYVILNNLQDVWGRYPKLKEQLSYRGKGKAARAIFDLIDTLKSLGFRHNDYRSVEDLSSQLGWLHEAGMTSTLRALRKELHDLYLLEYSSEEEEQQMMHENFMLFWCEATQRLFDQSIISFADQKYWPLIQLRSQLEQGSRLNRAQQYKAILVDEFQDINVLDLELLKAIAARHETDLTVVGDDDQAIYEWRGASPQFVVEPEKYLGREYATHILDVNYRSPSNIVHLSASLIRNNKRRVPKESKAALASEAAIAIRHPKGLLEAMDFVISESKSLLAQGDSSDIGIISRKRSQLIPYQIAFAREGIPFFADMDLHVLLTDAFKNVKKMLAIAGRATSTAFTETDPVEDVIALCDRVRRFGLPARIRQPLIRFLRSQSPRTLPEAVDALGESQCPLTDAPEFQSAIRGLIGAESVADKIRAISRGFEGLSKDYVKSRDDVFFTDPPFTHLAEYALEYGDNLGDFYRDIQEATAKLALLPTDEEQAFDDWKYRIQMMTALRAKGKEFDAVFILDANDGTWPSSMADSEEEHEQERRLFYVAFTRTRNRLYILTTQTLQGEPAVPSPYLAEMELRDTPLS